MTDPGDGLLGALGKAEGFAILEVVRGQADAIPRKVTPCSDRPGA